MNLQLEMLDTIEAPISASEGIAYGIIAFEVGMIIGMCIAT